MGRCPRSCVPPPGWPVPATRCCWPPPPPRWTCSATTPRAATRSPPPSACWTGREPVPGRCRAVAPAGGGRVTATAEAPAGAAREGFLDRPLTSLHLLLASTALLLGLGLVMVLSASMVDSYEATGSAYTVWVDQAVFVVLAVPVFWFGVRLSPRAYRRLAYPMLLLSLVLLLAVLVPGVGHNVKG